MFRHSLLSLAVFALVAPGAAAQTTIRVATVAPVNSSYHKALLDMGAEWETKTSGRVKLTVYAGGTQGSEEATLRMIRPRPRIGESGGSSGCIASLTLAFSASGTTAFRK